MATLLLDNFTGVGALASHVADSGQAWTVGNQPAANRLKLDGTRLYFDGFNSDWQTFVPVGVLVPQAPFTAEFVVRVGVMPANTGGPAAWFYMRLWNYMGLNLQLYYSGSVKTMSIQTQYVPAGGGGAIGEYDISPVFDNMTYTVRLEFTPGINTKIYLDGALVLTTSGPPKADVGSTAMDFYMEEDRMTLPAPYLFIDRITLGDSAPPPPPPAFWQSFVGSHEVV